MEGVLTSVLVAEAVAILDGFETWRVLKLTRNAGHQYHLSKTRSGAHLVLDSVLGMDVETLANEGLDLRIESYS